MNAKRFINILGAEYFTGVPDSLLRSLCDCIIDVYGLDPSHHVIAANEGNAVALAGGYYLATGKTPVVYMQNSGEGNIINPLASLLNEKVYAIPSIFVIGWRAEPGIHDEPQHIFQGEVTLRLLDTMDVPYYVVDGDTTEESLKNVMKGFSTVLDEGRQVAFVIKKNALTNENKVKYENNYTLSREAAIEEIVKHSGDSPVISTTGKTSRELFEIRERMGMSHESDFLTVGSMGHASSIALSIAVQKPSKRIWCIDGDGAALMHMGAMAVIGSLAPDNLIHNVINNGAHESVGGMPTAMRNIDLTEIAKSCGYKYCYRVESLEELDSALDMIVKTKELSFVEIAAKIGSRADLGRPTISQKDNKIAFMNQLSK
ncbi:MAG: phosphonopyruvate decarboxylase [Lachnospiraceae bacterium]|nr:phosphonopyruvate decarboxylase [Lachnospiraceae bacterium]